MAKTLEELKALKKQYQDALSAFGKDTLVGIFKPLFDENPTINAVRWKQYTPYFNDGDACTFGVGECYVQFGETAEGGDYDDGFVSSWEVREDAAKNAAVDAAHEVFSTIPEDVMLVVFGDHVTVTATRDGFEIEEYDHE